MATTQSTPITASLGAVNLSFNMGKLWFHCIAILYGGLYILFILEVWIISLLHVNCMIWVFKTVNLIWKTVASPEDKSSMLLKQCVVYFTCCDNGNCSKPHQWCYAYYTIVKDLVQHASHFLSLLFEQAQCYRSL